MVGFLILRMGAFNTKFSVTTQKSNLFPVNLGLPFLLLLFVFAPFRHGSAVL